MRTIGYSNNHSRPMGAVITTKIQHFGGHTNKPVKKPSHGH